MRSIAARKAEGPRARIKRREPARTGAGRCFRVEAIVVGSSTRCCSVVASGRIQQAGRFNEGFEGEAVPM